MTTPAESAAIGLRRCPECGGYALHRGECRTRPKLMAEDSAASARLRGLADEYDANVVSYGHAMAHDVLISELSEALDDLAAPELATSPVEGDVGVGNEPESGAAR